MEKPTITFDAEGKVRVLEADKFKATEDLEKEARSFLAKIQEFSSTVHSVVDNLSQQASRIEHAKLKAIGQRNLVEGEREARRQKLRELEDLIEERTSALKRLTTEYDSLAKIESEQRDVIEKLGNNEAVGV